LIFVILLSVLLAQVPGSDRGAPEGMQSPDTQARGTGEDRGDVEDARAPEPVIVIEKRSPTGALLRSAVLPGWGQFYNDEPVKGIVMGAAEIGLLSWLISEHIQAEDARTAYLETGDPGDLASYERHRGRRLDLIWYTSAAWLYGMLDAYVDAYLFSFDAENRSFERGAGIGVVVYIPI
jgi:hypothetical protein